MKKKNFRSGSLAIVMTLFILPVGAAMGFFDAMKITLFSSMSGVVTLQGKPVAGARIIRTAIPNNDKEYTDSTVTDENGRFHFDTMEASLWLKLLPTTIVVMQKMVIQHDGKEYLAWETGNFSGENNAELNESEAIETGRIVPIELRCELTDKETDKAGASTLVISGICSWEGQRILD